MEDFRRAWVEPAPKWQTCPKCNGEGKVPTNGVTTNLYDQCPVCLGMMIINTVTGWPPKPDPRNEKET